MSRRLISDLATVFEATLAAVDALPHGWIQNKANLAPLRVRLFSSHWEYMNQGSPLNSGGFYSLGDREIWIPLDRLDLRRGSNGLTLKPNQDFSLLIHEITHQVTHDWILRVPIWLAEGIALFMETVPYQRGQFQFVRYNPRDFLKLRELSSRDFNINDLSSVLNLSLDEWLYILETDRTEARLNYITAFFVFHYLLFPNPRAKEGF